MISPNGKPVAAAKAASDDSIRDNKIVTGFSYGIESHADPPKFPYINPTEYYSVHDARDACGLTALWTQLIYH